jgi:DNA-binding CsgD family transcriptional regulator
MVAPIDAPMICPIIVGRADYLAAIDTHLESLRSGRGGVMLIAGEAGIGKSRLLTEVGDRAGLHGVRVLMGRCFEPDRVLPYAPLLGLLRAHLAHLTDPADFQWFAESVPELARLVPDVHGWRQAASRPAVLDPTQEQRRLVVAWVRFLTELTGPGPTMVIVDDLHWADDASLGVLLALARRLADRPMLLALGYRTDEMTSNLRGMLAQLDRERLATELTLFRLSPADVEAMLRAIFAQAQPIRADFLRTICEITDGNPFFIEEVIRALVATGDIFQVDGRWQRRALSQLRIPRSVQDAVLRHRQNLSLEADTVLRLAAVAGRYFDFDLLAALTGYDESKLFTLMHELIGAQLVVEASNERFAFRHALTRQAVYAGLLSRERRLLHRRIAETLVRLHAAESEQPVADLAHHFAEGEAWAEARAYGERAGELALALFAPHAALAHLSRALEAAARLGEDPSARMLRSRSRARATLGDFDGALADLEKALARARAEGDRGAEWEALVDLGNIWGGLDYHRAGAALAAALALARDFNDSAMIAESLTQLGGWHLNREETDEAETRLQDALALFTARDNRAGIARTIDLLGTVSDIAGDIGEMRRRYERAALLFRDLDDRQALASTLATMLIPGGAYIFETAPLPPAVPAAQSRREADEALALAREIGWRAGEAYANLNRALYFSAYGNYDLAIASLDDGLAIANEISHGEWMTAGEWGSGVLFADLLAPSRAHAHFVRAHELGRATGSLHWLHITGGALIESNVAIGELDEAARIASSFAVDLPMRTLGQRRVWVGRAKLALAADDAPAALAIVDRLDPRAAESATFTIPLLSLLRGDCLIALDRDGETEFPVRETLRIAAERELLPLAWRCHAALARLLARRGERSAAGIEARAAREIVTRLAASLPDAALSAVFVERATALLPSEPAATAREKSLLTGREREVARLVAHGRSNRDIADALSIGERTVETHVSHILGKLGFATRVEIAAWATASPDLSANSAA